MRVMVLIKATNNSEAGVMPDTKLLDNMSTFNEELVKAGIMLSGEGLHPTSKGTRIKFMGNQRIVIQGPFTGAKDLIAGFWIWQVGSMEEAVEWAKRCPNPTGFESEIEIRPIFETEDFGEALTPELREREENLRAQLNMEK